MPSATAGAAGAGVHAVKRFVETLPSLQQLLALPAASDHELRLRAEMRRTIARLAATLHAAARTERKKSRAAVYRAAAMVAADLADTPVSRDH